jgi:hydrogenase maturation protease
LSDSVLLDEFTIRRDPAPPVAPGTLVLALGNPLRGDDGVGAEVLLALERLAPQDVNLLDGGTMGLNMLLAMQGYHRVIIVDSGNIGRAPGEWGCFTADELLLQSVGDQLAMTLHNAGLAEALTVGATLGILPPEIIIYAVQPMDIGWLQGLSEPVQQAIPEVCAAILTDVC